MNAEYAKARRHLSRRDPVLKQVIARIGDCQLQPEPDEPLALLVRCVIAQQISTKAAITIRQRLHAKVKQFTPQTLTALPEAEYRSCGISSQKYRTIQAIVARVAAEPAFLTNLPVMNDDELRAAITSIKGLGPWSADMLMMFGFGRLDVLPVGDLVIQVAMQKLWELDERPKAPTMLELAEPWRPYRTVASWYLWRTRDESDAW